MSQKRDKAPAPIVRKTERGLKPTAGLWAEMIMADPNGTEYDLVKRSRRSNPQNSLYWATLNNIVRATDKWPTAEHLHDELKIVCGYTRKAIDWETGEVHTITDSTAFNAMSADEFRVYFDKAMEKLADYLGFDPLAFEVAA